MAASVMLLLPALVFLAGTCTAQVRQVEVIRIPPPLMQPPMLLGMMDMMERVMNELLPGPMIAPVVPEAPLVVVAGNETRGNDSSRPHVDVAIDIKMVPLAGPDSPIAPLLPALPGAVIAVSGSEGKPRERLHKEKASSAKKDDASRRVAVLEVSKTNRSKPAVLEAITQNGDEKAKKAEADVTVANVTNTSVPAGNASAREEVPPAAHVEVVRRPPSAEAQQLPVSAAAAPGSAAAKHKGSETHAASAGAASKVAGGTKAAGGPASSSESSLATTCYSMFVKHGVLLLVLSVVCGVSCLLGALLPVLFGRRRRGQVSQYPPAKRRFAPARILADPAVLRMFRRRENMVA